jgi:signal transduction histidine kinase
VDREGIPLGPTPAGWTVVEVHGPDRVIAELRADLAGVAPAALEPVLRGPARLALENNRLAAEATVRAEQIRASAARLVDLAEQGRRRLERDLHDGAQRHVLTLGLAVRSDTRLSEAVRREAAASVRAVLEQLRDVAHGIRPPQLDTGGLARGLAVLADHSLVPLVVGPVPTEVAGPPAEAAYRLVEDVLRTAAGPVTVEFAGDPAAWDLTVAVAAGGSVAPDAGDRVRALGGTIRSEPTGHGWRHVATLGS